MKLHVTFTISGAVARRAHLHRRRVAEATRTGPGVATLRIGPKTLKALRRAHGRLTATVSVQGPQIPPSRKTLTLRR